MLKLCVCALGKLSNVGSHFKGLLTRDADVCDWQCDAANGTVTANSSWDIVLTVNESLQFNIGYEAGSDVIAIIHQSLEVALAIDGKNGIVGLFNISSGGCIVVNITSGVSVYVNASSSVGGFNSSGIDVSAAIEFFTEVIVTGAFSVGAGADTTSGNLFNLGVIFSAVYKNPTTVITADGYYNGRVELLRLISTSFDPWFDILREEIVEREVDTDSGIFGLLIFEPTDVVSVGLVKVLVALYANSSGRFNGEFTLAIYNIITSGSSSNITKGFASLTATIEAIGSLYVSLDAALSAYLSGNGLVSFSQETVVIAEKTYVLSYGRTADDSWFINLKSKSDASVDVIVAYERTSNLFVIYNRRLNIILLFSGTYSLFAIWNVKTGEGIIVRYSTGAAVVISANTSISTSFSSGAILQGVISIGAKIQDYRYFGYSPRNTSTFLFSTYISTLQARGLTAANLAVSSTVSAVINASFSAFFELVVAERESYVAEFGVLNVIYVASGSIAGGWSSKIQAFIAAIYSSKLQGRFNAKLIDCISYEIYVNASVVSSDTFLSSETSAVKSITRIDGDIDWTTRLKQLEKAGEGRARGSTSVGKKRHASRQ